MFVGIGQSGAARRSGNPDVDQPPQTTPEAVADLAQRIGASELTEQHGDELRPAGKALGVTLSGVLLYECGELGSGKVLEQLIEEARDLYDWIALLWAAFGEAPGKEWLANVNYRRARLLFQTASPCLGQQCCNIAFFRRLAPTPHNCTFERCLKATSTFPCSIRLASEKPVFALESRIHQVSELFPILHILHIDELLEVRAVYFP